MDAQLSEIEALMIVAMRHATEARILIETREVNFLFALLRTVNGKDLANVAAGTGLSLTALYKIKNGEVTRPHPRTRQALKTYFASIGIPIPRTAEPDAEIKAAE